MAKTRQITLKNWGSSTDFFASPNVSEDGARKELSDLMANELKDYVLLPRWTNSFRDCPDSRGCDKVVIKAWYWRGSWADPTKETYARLYKPVTVKSFDCDGNLEQYKDCMLFDSGTVIAELDCSCKGHEVSVELSVRGEVSVSFGDEVYHKASDFPETLKDKIKNNPYRWDCEDGIYIGMNNWFECIYSVDGGRVAYDGVVVEEDLSKYTADELKAYMVEIAKQVVA